MVVFLDDLQWDRFGHYSTLISRYDAIAAIERIKYLYWTDITWKWVDEAHPLIDS